MVVQMIENIENEFSRLVNLELITKKSIEDQVEATTEECKKLATRFDIVKVDYLNAKYILKKQSQKDVGDYLLTVKMKAEIIQECVVTLAELKEIIDEEFTIIFQRALDVNNEAEHQKEIEFDVEERDVEIIKNMEVDIGEYVAEYLSLSMNPYPRKSDIKEGELSYELLDENEARVDAQKKNPFNVLKDIKHKT